jgi:small subunit ribosomal protein S17
MSEEKDTTEARTPEDEPTSEAPHASASDADSTSDESAQPGAEAPTPSEEGAGEAAASPPVPPKERRQRSRAGKAARTPVSAPRTPEERHADRLGERKAKASARRVERERARAKARAGKHETAETPPREHAPGVQKVRQGVVVSDAADKTITVRIDTTGRHRRYQKIVRTSRTLHAHDERNDAHVGDTVIVRESRPLSRTKRWRLIEVVQRAK